MMLILQVLEDPPLVDAGHTVFQLHLQISHVSHPFWSVFGIRTRARSSRVAPHPSGNKQQGGQGVPHSHIQELNG